MKLKRYNSFLSIDENVAQAKKYLLDKYLKDSGAKKEDLKPEQIKQLERMPDYVKIRDLVSRNPGWTYVFTRFFFEDEIPFNELEALYNKLVELKPLLVRLPKAVDKYIEPEERNGSKRTAYEDLSDDLENILRYRDYKHFIDELPAKMKHEVESSGVVMKEKLENLAVEFYKLDPELQKNFIKKLSRYTALNDLVRVMESYLKASSGEGFSTFIKKIEELNKRMSEKHGAEILYINEDTETIIIELKSFEACKTLCANTSWCIAQWHSHWESYVGGDNVFSKQYAIFNFSLSPADNKSIIGCTIEQNNHWRTGHVKNDSPISEKSFRSLLSKEENDVIVGPTKDEVAAKKRYVEASKVLKKDNITLDQAKKAIADGAGVNTGAGIPLINAVKAGNIPLIEYYLSNGAVPNLSPDEKDAPINHTTNLDIIKMLVAKGANFTPKAFKNFVDNSTGVFNKEAIEYFLKNGMNINFQEGYALRSASKHDNLGLISFLVEKGANPNAKNGMAFCWSCEWARLAVVDYFLKCGKLTVGFKRGFELAYKRYKKMSSDKSESEQSEAYRKISENILAYAKDKDENLYQELVKIKEDTDKK